MDGNASTSSKHGLPRLETSIELGIAEVLERDQEFEGSVYSKKRLAIMIAGNSWRFMAVPPDGVREDCIVQRLPLRNTQRGCSYDSL